MACAVSVDKNTSFPDGCLPLGFFMLVDKHNLPPNCCLDKIGFSSLAVWLYSYNSANIWYADIEGIALENVKNMSLQKKNQILQHVQYYLILGICGLLTSYGDMDLGKH